MKRKPTIALALGGGGARGIAHLGVIQAFEEAGVRPDLIVGSSAGALVGAAYAATADLCATLRRVEEIFGSGQPGVNGFRKFTRFQNIDAQPRHLLDRILRSWAKEIVVGCVMFRKAVMSEKHLRECIAAFVPEIDIEQTQIPLIVSAVDLISGQAAALRSGPLVEAVMASCAVPGFMPPVDWDGQMLIDGAVVHGIPVDVARDAGADLVVGVDVGMCLCHPPPLNDGIDILNRAMEIMNSRLSDYNARSADRLIAPDVKRFGWTDFHCAEELIAEGRKAAHPVCQELARMVQMGRMKRRWLSSHPFRWLKSRGAADPGGSGDFETGTEGSKQGHRLSDDRERRAPRHVSHRHDSSRRAL